MELTATISEKMEHCLASRSDCESISECSSTVSVDATLLSNTVMVLNILENAVQRGTISTQFATSTFEAWVRRKFEHAEDGVLNETSSEQEQYDSVSTIPETRFRSQAGQSLMRLLSLPAASPQSYNSVSNCVTNLSSSTSQKTTTILRRTSYKDRFSRLFACGSRFYDDAKQKRAPRPFSLSLPRLGSLFGGNSPGQFQKPTHKESCKSVAASIRSTESDYMLYDTFLSTSACSSFHSSQTPSSDISSRELPPIPRHYVSAEERSSDVKTDSEYEDLDQLPPS